MPLPIYTSAAFTNGSGVSVASNASVEVRRESDGSLINIFEDRDGETQITQPGFQADLEGRFEFYADPSAEGWEITVTAGADTHTLNGQFPQGGAEIRIAEAVTTASSVNDALTFVGRGAIVESGTNANGSFVRWENGEQVCFATDRQEFAITDQQGNLFRNAQNAELPFPATFTEVVAVSGGKLSPSGFGAFVEVGYNGPGQEWRVCGYRGGSATVTFDFECIAWGFWK